ncbi:50S ribosomal protein L11 [bacterium]|nr:50S ribosomal protein L11 [bacterium]
MAKKVVGSVKLQIKGGQATMAPPVGPALGQRGINGMEFIKAFNAKTADQMGMITPVIITYYSDKSFTFITKTPPASVLLLKELGLPKGSKEPNKSKIGKITKAQIKKIAEIKLPDLYVNSIESAMSMIEGTAKNMGILVED